MATAVDVRAMLAASASGAKQARPSSLVPDREDDLTYDLGHLYAYDPTPVDAAALADEGSAYLIRVARDNAQLLTNKLYGLLDGSANKQSIPLPPPTMQLPREKPLPEGKPTTRWEKFAAKKGIQKKKRSKMVWDEATQQWAPRYGFGRANSAKDARENWVIEAKPGDDGSVDPFDERATAQREKKSKQMRQEQRNKLEAAHAAAGAAPGGGRAAKKAQLQQAISAAQVSTASVGRFDRALPNEPSKSAGKRKQYEHGVGTAAAEKDAARTAAVAAKMFPDSGVKRGAASIDRSRAAKISKLSHESANRSSKKGGGGGSGKGGGKGKGKKKGK